MVSMVEVADAAGIKVTAHAHSAESIKIAILAGVSSIEHTSLGNDESVALALEHNVAPVTSLPADHMEIGADVGALEVGRYGDLVAVRGNPLSDIALLQGFRNPAAIFAASLEARTPLLPHPE
jgi:imidazolonepropionase-like amidohydrolase